MKLSDLKKSGYKINVPGFQTSKLIGVRKEQKIEKIFMSKEEMEQLKNIVIPEYEKEWMRKKEEFQEMFSEVEFAWMVFVRTKKRERLDKAIESVYEKFLEIGKKSKKYEIERGLHKTSKFDPREWANERTKKMLAVVMKDSNVFYK